MTERLLQHIWQFQHFNTRELALSSGEHFRVMHPGTFNTNQGPDFLEARIKIGDTLWVGQVELHVKTSDWYKHAHQFDRNYNNVILHVVWENDMSNIMQRIPVFALKDRVPGLLLNQYEHWMNSQSFIPCNQQAGSVPELIWMTWKDRLLVERLQRKTATILSYLQQTNHHWEEVLWWLLARNFGIKVNAEAFEAIARSLPVTLLAKHKNQLLQLEALLLGQAGLLEGNVGGEYPQLLQKEYNFFKHKYQLQPVRIPVHFLRMRPSAFPTLRLAQLATLVGASNHLFSRIKEIQDASEIRDWLTVTASNFWDHHYTINEPSAYKPKRLGARMIDNIIINTIAPILFAYAHFHNDISSKERAIQWLSKVEAETNSITIGFGNLQVTNKTAFDSQALIELKTNYCDKKRCLDCTIGNSLLKKTSPLVVVR